MTMQQQLWSLNALAVELDRDRRSLARDLEGLAPDDEVTVGSTTRTQEDAFSDDSMIDTAARKQRRWKLHRVITHLYKNAGAQMNLLDQEKHRLLKEQADKVAFENELKREQYVNVVVVQREWANLIVACRSRLLAIPSKFAARLVNVKSPQLIFRIAEKEIHNALNELAGQLSREELDNSDEMGALDQPSHETEDFETDGQPDADANDKGELDELLDTFDDGENELEVTDQPDEDNDHGKENDGN